VQPVRKLHHDDANVVDHGQEHFPDIFGLPRLGSQQVQPVDFRNAFDQAGDVRAKPLHDARRGYACVLHHIVQQGGAKRRNVELHVRQDVRHFEGMREVRVAGLAQLRAVLFGGEFERPAKAARYRPQARLPDFSTNSRKRDCSARVVRLSPALTSEAIPWAFRAMTLFYILKLFDATGRKEFRACEDGGVTPNGLPQRNLNDGEAKGGPSWGRRRLL